MEVSSSPQLVGPPAIHGRALDIADAYQLNADVVTTISLVGNPYKLFGGYAEVRIDTDDQLDIGSRDGAMQAVRAQQQDVAGQKLVLADIGGHEKIAPDRAA